MCLLRSSILPDVEISSAIGQPCPRGNRLAKSANDMLQQLASTASANFRRTGAIQAPVLSRYGLAVGDGEGDGLAVGRGAGEGLGVGRGGQFTPSCLVNVVIRVTPLRSISFESWFGAHTRAF